MTHAPTGDMPEPHGFRITGWHVLAGFMLFFGLVTAVDVKMVVDAYRSYPGEVASTPYEDGLAYDTELNQQRAQVALGWRMSAGQTGDGTIVLTARDASGAPLSGLRLRARLERPATEQGRRAVQFHETAPGTYQARTSPLHGAWDLRLSAYDAGGRRFDAERRLVAP